MQAIKLIKNVGLVRHCSLYFLNRIPLQLCSRIQFSTTRFSYDFLLNIQRSVPSSPVSTYRQLHTSIPFFGDIIGVKVPPFAESVSEGDIRWEKKVGDSVKEDDLIAEIETDKTSVSVPAPKSGVITELLVADGSKVTPGMEVCKIEQGAGGGASATKSAEVKPASSEKTIETPEKAVEKSSKPEPAEQKSKTKVVSPPADLSKLKVTTSKPAAASSSPSPSSGAGGITRGEERVKMNRMRLKIAQRLKDSQNTAAMLTTFNEVDMSSIFELRTRYKDAFAKKHEGIKLGFMSAFVKASAYALKEMPVVNAVIDDASSEIIYRDYVDISIAVASPKGLVVPVLRNVQTMSFADIERNINQLGEKARANALAIEDMDGGTFTISNGGVFGSMFGTPIINPPQSAILGMHGIFDRPMAVSKASGGSGSEVGIRPMMYVALTYDHRLIDGREAVTFLRKIKAFVEDPRIILLDL